MDQHEMQQELHALREKYRELEDLYRGAIADLEHERRKNTRALEMHAHLDLRLQEKTQRVEQLEREKRQFRDWVTQ